MAHWKPIAAFALLLAMLAAIFAFSLRDIALDEVQETTLILVLVVVIWEVWRRCFEPPPERSDRNTDR